MTIEQRRGVAGLALIAAFMVFVDGTIVNLALAQLSAHLDASRSQLEWAVNAYTLSFAAVMLGGGGITDVLGAKRAFIAGLLIFTSASAVCAVAGSMLVFNGARLVQGIGSALLLPSALVLGTSTAPDEQSRHRLVGRWAAAGGVGMAAGPLLGSLLVWSLGWRAIFAVNVIVGVPALVWSIKAMPTIGHRIVRLDRAGMTAAALAIGGLVFTLIEGPAVGWTAGPVIVAAGVAVAGGVGFAIAERTARSPLLPLAVYTDRRFVTTAVQGALFNFSFYGLLFALSLHLQQGRGLSPLASGLMFIPLTGLISVGNLIAAPIGQRLGRRKLLGLAQLMLVVSFVAVVATATISPLWPLGVALLPAGLSSGTLVATMTGEAISGVNPALHGSASAVFNTSRQIGAAIGVATFGPLLGAAAGLRAGFIDCLLVGTAATVAALALTLFGRPHNDTGPRLLVGCATRQGAESNA